MNGYQPLDGCELRIFASGGGEVRSRNVRFKESLKVILHSNIQGATDMGGVSDIFPGYLKIDPNYLPELKEAQKQARQMLEKIK